jgi:hypothetical protein
MLLQEGRAALLRGTLDAATPPDEQHETSTPDYTLAIAFGVILPLLSAMCACCPCSTETAMPEVRTPASDDTLATPPEGVGVGAPQARCAPSEKSDPDTQNLDLIMWALQQLAPYIGLPLTPPEANDPSLKHPLLRSGSAPEGQHPTAYPMR